jgi:acyl-homoserine lactone acylase PvdQ
MVVVMRIDFLSRVYEGVSRRVLPLILGLILILFVGSQTTAVPTKSTEILWDTFGVPHIYAKDDRSAFYAFGWAQMQSHGDLLLRLYGQARGRAAEYWGEEYTESDQWVLTTGIPERARTWYKAQSPTFRSYLDAFAAGINAYASQHGDLINDEVEAVLPVKSQRSVRMLDEDKKISFDEMVAYKHSTRMELADRILDDLIPAARKYGQDLGRRAANVLEAWDRQANADSRGAVLFAFWVDPFLSGFILP